MSYFEEEEETCQILPVPNATRLLDILEAAEISSVREAHSSLPDSTIQKMSTRLHSPRQLNFQIYFATIVISSLHL